MSLNELISRNFSVPQTTILGPATDGNSAAIDTSDLTAAYILFTQSGTNTTGTFQVWVSNDGTTWFKDGADVTTTGGIVHVPAKDFKMVRIKCTDNVSGASNVWGASISGRRAWRTG